MGIVRKQLSQSNNMKFLLVLAVAAYAKAEAEPRDPRGFVYSVGHPLTYAYHYPLTYRVPVVYTAAAGCRNNDGALVPCAQGVLPTLPYYGLVPAVAAAPAAEAEDEAVVSVEKREATAEADAEADPEADPWYAYYAAHPYAYAGYGGYYAPHAYSYAPYTYGHVYSHYGVGYAGHPYGYGYHGYSGYLPYSYGYHLGGCRNGYGALVPCAGK